MKINENPLFSLIFHDVTWPSCRGRDLQGPCPRLPDAGTHSHSVPQCLWTRPGVRGTPTAGATLGKSRSRIHPLVTKHTIYLEFTTIIKKHNYMFQFVP